MAEWDRGFSGLMSYLEPYVLPDLLEFFDLHIYMLPVSRAGAECSHVLMGRDFHESVYVGFFQSTIELINFRLIWGFE